jgi:hypothetical protein
MIIFNILHAIIIIRVFISNFDISGSIRSISIIIIISRIRNRLSFFVVDIVCSIMKRLIMFVIIKDIKPKNRCESINFISIFNRFEIKIRIEILMIVIICIFNDRLCMESICPIVNSDDLSNERYFMPKVLINYDHGYSQHILTLQHSSRVFSFHKFLLNESEFRAITIQTQT